MDGLKDRWIRNCVRFLSHRTHAGKLIEEIAADHRIDLLPIAFRQSGILNFRNSEESGERHLLTTMKTLLADRDQPVLFDVGANVGEYSTQLREAFPAARILAIEPGPGTFADLVERTRQGQIEAFNCGFSDRVGHSVLHRYANQPASSHASIHREVLADLHRRDDLVEDSINLITLDEFCRQHDVRRIDFLKIDTEGHELAILRGATECLANGAIQALQFEFNEMNVVSRVFLKDFYDVLTGFTFYRLVPGGLLPLGPYSARHEIFQFQNIAAFSPQMTVDLQRQGLMTMGLEDQHRDENGSDKPQV